MIIRFCYCKNSTVKPSTSNRKNIKHKQCRKILNMLSQDKYTSNKLYMDRFTNARDMIKHMGGSLPNYPALIDVALKKKDLD